jgi:hypothetical protein
MTSSSNPLLSSNAPRYHAWMNYRIQIHIHVNTWSLTCEAVISSALNRKLIEGFKALRNDQLDKGLEELECLDSIPGLVVSGIDSDYRFKDRKRTSQVYMWHWCHYNDHISLKYQLPQKTPIISAKITEPFNQEMPLKIPFLRRGLRLSHSKPHRQVSALQLFEK